MLFSMMIALTGMVVSGCGKMNAILVLLLKTVTYLHGHSNPLPGRDSYIKNS
jgi:hypothetical protein